MRIAVTGASGVLGRGLAARLLSRGHDVVGIARHRPDSWSSAADFVAGDIRDAVAVKRCLAGADVVAHCAWAKSPGPESRISHQVNIDGTLNVLAAMSATGTARMVFPSSAHVYDGGVGARAEYDSATPASADGMHKVRVEEMLAASDVQSVVIRSALVVGRSVDNWVRRLLALPAFPGGTADRPVQVVHLDDALRLFMRAVLDNEIDSGPVNLAAPGAPTFRQIAAALGRPVIPLGGPFAALVRRRG
ncbi:MAG TPA: NAD-dependent epimerase/dehydratase family protein, partial [Mycobacterium sp.]|nr:NAD-dependent epimerase/dehydratase family protein [Mycobacterium sp.]